MQGFPIAREEAPNNKVDRAPFSALPITRAANPLGTASREAAPTLFFARQAMAFFLRIFVATVVLLACALCGPVPAQAAPRPAIAFVHRLLPPEGERRTGLMDWVRSHDLARDILESQRIATVVAAVPAENPLELGNIAAMHPEVLITTSPRLYEATRALSRQYPDTVFFACTDETVDGNISGYEARTYEAYYLAGLLAGALSEGVVGYLGNSPYLSDVARHRNANAFTLGAQAARPRIRVLFAADGDATRQAQAMIAAGADIITIERAAPSLLQLMRDHAVRYIGSTERENDPLFLAAPAWNWGKAFGDLLAQVRFGIWRPRNVSYGIREGVVSLSPLGPSVPTEVRQRLHEAEEALRRGASPFRGPVFDDRGQLRVSAGKNPDETTLRGMDWNVRGMERLPSGF